MRMTTDKQANTTYTDFNFKGDHLLENRYDIVRDAMATIKCNCYWPFRPIGFRVTDPGTKGLAIS